jgi:16S rRNA U1498 N3-methylase RsmE
MEFLFETNRATRAPRRIQQIIKETAEQAKITIVPDSKEWNKILSFFSPPYTMS